MIFRNVKKPKSVGEMVIPGTQAIISEDSKVVDTSVYSTDSIFIACDLPDFLFVVDSTNKKTGVKAVRIEANQPITITDINEFIKSLTLENLDEETRDTILSSNLKNILTKEESSRIVSFLKMLVGTEDYIDSPLALVKIAKQDGTRPDVTNKYEMYEAIENLYAKISSIKFADLVIFDISADDKFDYTEKTGTGTFKINSIEIDGAYITDGSGVKFSKTYKADFTGATLNAEDGKHYSTITINNIEQTFEVTSDGKLVNSELIVLSSETGEVEETNNGDISVYVPSGTAVGGFQLSFSVVPPTLEYFEDVTDSSVINKINLELVRGYRIASVLNAELEIVEVGPSINLVLNGKTIAEGLVLTEDNFISLNDDIEIMLLKDNVVGSKLSLRILPYEANFVGRAAEFAYEMSKNLKDVIVTFGLELPNDVSSLDDRIDEISKMSFMEDGAFKVSFDSSSNKVDLGKYINLVFGSIKNNSMGGITNFPYVSVKDFERSADGTIKESNSKIVLPKTDMFGTDSENNYNGKANIELAGFKGTKSVKVKINSSNIESINNVYSDKTIITLKNAVDLSVFDLENFETGVMPITLNDISSKDINGSMAASYYRMFANNYVDKSPISKKLPVVTCDLKLNEEQSELLGNNVIILDKTSDGYAEVKTGRNLSYSESKLKEIGDLNVLFYFIRKIREISDSYRGSRFATPEKKLLFKDAISKPLNDDLTNETPNINSYTLTVNWDYIDDKKSIEILLGVDVAGKGNYIYINAGLDVSTTN